MPKPSSATILQIVRVAGSRSMRAEIAPALTGAGPLTFMFPRLRPDRALPARIQCCKDARQLYPVKCRPRDRFGRPGRLLLLQHDAVEAQWAAAGEGEIEEDEAEQDRRVAAVDDWVEGLRRVRHEIGNRHLAGENERHDPRVGPEDEHHTSNYFQNRRDNEKGGERRRAVIRKAERFGEAILQKHEPSDNAQETEDEGPHRI